MRSISACSALFLLASASSSLAAGGCEIDFISHGHLEEIEGTAARPSCLVFVDDLGDRYEIRNPRGAWRDGMTGTVVAQWELESSCTEETPLRVCRFEADFTTKVTGELIVINLIECPGYFIRTNRQDYRITNCGDFGTDLCATQNIGRKVQADLFVDTGISICIGSGTSTVLGYRFIR